ncbi:photosynthetic complex putative assembly protein PuhB [Anianabacter salinae]|uniref:photosynthetic complex putative assembly protein PuhB n=1 Tax=Anianabacter salinae TaxID=2851023 RepID=UPI00225DDA74|nr:photosynthetic complex putative assembly protein PuhB [Anianabacter salinae]MBV0914209.1 PH domain-containing protein [Anianabacter salinae]
MSHDDFAVEPIPGLPGVPPRGEAVLWQGRPDTWALARESMLLYWVAGYFVLLCIWRVTTAMLSVPTGQALLSAVPLIALGLLACGIIYGIAWIQARGTVYTITTARVAVRGGAALTVTFNLPFAQIEGASLDLKPSGTGTIALGLKGDNKISYLVAWPHVRPWRMKKTEPALRCIPEAARVADILRDAAETRISQPAVSMTGPAARSAVPAE